VRQLLEEDDLGGALVTGEAVGDELDELILLEMHPRFGHDERLHRLAGMRMCHADDRHFGDAGMRRDRVFDFRGIHVEARHDDQVLGAIDEVQVAVVVGDGNVAGTQPAVVGLGGGGRLVVLPVAGEHVGPAHPDLAGVAVERVLAFFVDEAYFDPR
jgi:hypothetical protein